MFNNMIVFDINGTLLKRIFKAEKQRLIDFYNLNKTPNTSDTNYNYYFRNHLQELNTFLKENNINYGFWSTMYSNNALNAVKALNSVGLFTDYKFIFSQDHCKYGREKGKVKAEKWVKDLSLVASEFHVPVENCLLIDDSEVKVYEGNYFFIVKEFDGLENDDEIFNVINAINKFINKNI